MKRFLAARHLFTFSAVALDFDGVLVDSPATHMEAWTAALATVGVTAPSSEIYLLEGAKDLDIATKLCQTGGSLLSSDELTEVCRWRDPGGLVRCL